MKKWILVGVAISFFGYFANVGADTASDNKAAQTTVENWFAAMKNTPESAGKYLLPEFVSIHTDCVARDKNQEMALIKNLHMKDYHLSNFKFGPTRDMVLLKL